MADRPMPGWLFHLMALEFRIKARSGQPERVLDEAGIETGAAVLDFGCGPGRYTVPAARRVGASGRLFALDLHPLALRYVDKAARRARLHNVHGLLSDGLPVPLPDASVDVVLLYNTLHDVGAPADVLRELHRVLRPDGVLSFRDHSLAADDVNTLFLASGLFVDAGSGALTRRFSRRGETT
jgi:ubiquinone/menaquinone biosynthesis C-methylase UbiE